MVRAASNRALAGTALSLILAAVACSAAAAQPATRSGCAQCHSDREFLTGKGGSPGADAGLFVPDSLLHGGAHESLQCTSCHIGYDLAYPHQPGTTTEACGACHESAAAAWSASMHAAAAGNGDAPGCATCHGVHRVLSASDPGAPTHPLVEARLCGECHADPHILETYFADPADSVAREAATRYHETVHGIAVSQAGLIVSATCSDCHDAHLVLPSDSAASSVARANVTSTCGTCHEGVLDDYRNSAHGRAFADSASLDPGRSAPVCTDCHSAHGVAPPEQSWRTDVIEECGACHETLYETYFHTYHGKVTRLGSEIAAKCSDCHTPHANLPPDDPASSVHAANRVETCGRCHEQSNARFVQYLAHGTHRDREAFPQLYWTWLLMTSLLVGVFGFFGLHTSLWLYRSLRGTPARFAPAAAPPEPAAATSGDAAPATPTTAAPAEPEPDAAGDDPAGGDAPATDRPEGDAAGSDPSIPDGSGSGRPPESENP